MFRRVGRWVRCAFFDTPGLEIDEVAAVVLVSPEVEADFYGIAGLGVMAALISAIATQHRRSRRFEGAHGEEVANDESEQATGA